MPEDRYEPYFIEHTFIAFCMWIKDTSGSSYNAIYKTSVHFIYRTKQSEFYITFLSESVSMVHTCYSMVGASTQGTLAMPLGSLTISTTTSPHPCTYKNKLTMAKGDYQTPPYVPVR